MSVFPGVQLMLVGCGGADFESLALVFGEMPGPVGRDEREAGTGWQMGQVRHPSTLNTICGSCLVPGG